MAPDPYTVPDVFLFDVKRWPFVGALLPGLLAALAMLFAFPAFDVWWLVFLAPIPLVLIAVYTGGPWRSGLAVALTFLAFWAWHQRWVLDISAAGFAPLILYLTIYPGLFVAITGRVLRRWPRLPAWVAAPVVWVGLEVVRGELVWDGYAWYLLAHPTIAWPALASIASIAGTYVVSGVVMLPASVLVDGIRRASTPRAAHAARAMRLGWRVGFGVTVLTYAWIASPWSPDARRQAQMDRERATPTIRFAVVQTSVPQDNKVAWTIEQRLDDFATFMAMTIQAAQGDPAPDVIVWPETMFPGYTLSPAAVEEQRRSRLGYRNLGVATTVFHDRLVELQGELGIPMIVGALGAEGHRIVIGADGALQSITTDRQYNSAFLIADGRVSDPPYDKIHLTPFGEIMPYISAWPWLEQKLLDLGAEGMSFDLSEGGAPVRLEIPVAPAKLPAGPGDAPARLPVATPICFEVSSPDVVRRLVFDGSLRRADVIVQLTNDGWFGRFKGGRATHLQIARWRCVELATPMVRAANTGISAAVDARGRMLREYAIPLEPGRAVGSGPNPPGLLNALIRPASPDDRTPYLLVRDRVGWVAAGVMGLALVGTFFGGPRTERRRRRTNATGDSASSGATPGAEKSVEGGPGGEPSRPKG